MLHSGRLDIRPARKERTCGKHSSLFSRKVSDDEKKGFITFEKDPVEFLSFLLSLQVNNPTKSQFYKTFLNKLTHSICKLQSFVRVNVFYMARILPSFQKISENICSRCLQNWLLRCHKNLLGTFYWNQWEALALKVNENDESYTKVSHPSVYLAWKERDLVHKTRSN